MIVFIILPIVIKISQSRRAVTIKYMELIAPTNHHIPNGIMALIINVTIVTNIPIRNIEFTSIVFLYTFNSVSSLTVSFDIEFILSGEVCV